MVDRLFSEPKLAAVYDAICANDTRGDFGFHLQRIMAAASVLDVGCGTGDLLRRARDAGHTGRLCGIDPAPAMLDRARRYAGIEWVLGDLPSAGFTREFDLVVMTGHVFQVFTGDEQLRRTLAAVRAALTDRGRFSFETRNPDAREWERWTPENVREVAGPDGELVGFSHTVDTHTHGDLVTFTSTFTSPAWRGTERSTSTLRFLDAAGVERFLREAGLEIEEQFGDWDEGPFGAGSPEIIVIARRA